MLSNKIKSKLTKMGSIGFILFLLGCNPVFADDMSEYEKIKALYESGGGVISEKDINWNKVNDPNSTLKSVADGEFVIPSKVKICPLNYSEYTENPYDLPKYYVNYYNLFIDEVLDYSFIELLKNKVDINEIYLAGKGTEGYAKTTYDLKDYIELNKILIDRNPYAGRSSMDLDIKEEAKNTPVIWLDNKAEKMVYDAYVESCNEELTEFLYGNKNPDSEYMFCIQDLIDSRVVKLTAEHTKGMSFDEIVNYKNMLEKNNILKTKIEIEKKDFTKEELTKLKGSILDPDIKYNGEYIFINEKGELKENIDEEVLQILLDNDLTVNLKFTAKQLDLAIKPEYFYLFQECRKDYGYEPCEVNYLHSSDMSNYENIVYEPLYRQAINNYIDMKDVNEFDINNGTDMIIYIEYMRYFYEKDIKDLTPRDFKVLDIGIEFKKKGYSLENDTLVRGENEQIEDSQIIVEPEL